MNKQQNWLKRLARGIAPCIPPVIFNQCVKHYSQIRIKGDYSIWSF